jgi:hypothetical protein
MKSKVLLVVVSLGLCISCEEVFFEPDSPNTASGNFEQLWRDFDQYYSFFETKNIDWDSMYAAMKPRITPATTDNQLFDIFKEMILYLRDGHAVVCSSPSRCAFHDFRAGHPLNRLKAIPINVTRKSNTIFSSIISSDIGFVYIQSFGGKSSDFDVIDEILAKFKEADVKGIIVDVRGNGGGSDLYSRFIANRFVKTETVYAYYRYKSGPAHNDFGPWQEKKIIPEGELVDKPVIVLTNREVFSSAEDFILAMKSAPCVTVLGDTTGGGSGNPLLRTLANGWTFRVPRWQQVGMDYVSYEGKGISPDVAIWISADDERMNKDTILESAIALLRK